RRGHPVLPSLPTRRSSDLARQHGQPDCRAQQGARGGSRPGGRTGRPAERIEGRSACARGGSRVTMHQVTIDGITYAPVGATESPRIGVAVTTRNRHNVVAKTLESIHKYTPGVRVVVVDDASEPAVAGATYRF